MKKPHAMLYTMAEANRHPHQLSSRGPCAEVRAQFRPLGARDLRTFFPAEKSAKNPLICRIGQIGRTSCGKRRTTQNWNVNVLLGSRCWKTCFTKRSRTVLGENREDLHQDHDENEELDCQRSAPQKRNNSVRGEQPGRPPPPPPTVCSTGCLITSMRETIVGASTNCPAVCGTERTVRGQREGVDILGGTRTSRAGNPGAASTIWSNVRRRSLSCGLTSQSRSGRAPPGSSSNDNSKSSGWGVGGSQIVAV